MKQNGFSFMELLIVIAIISITIFIVFRVVSNTLDRPGSSYGINGYVETRCISGFKFTIDGNGQVRQVMSELGKGVPCN